VRSLPPSPRLGLRLAFSQWPLVIAVWVAPMVLGASLMAVVALVLRPALGAPVAVEERWLLAAEALRPMWPVVAVLAGLTVVAGWAWTVLWHAGVARWQVWHGASRPRLAEVLGLGIAGWWPFARLSLTAGSVLAVLVAIVWLPVSAVYGGATGEAVLSMWGLLGGGATGLVVLFVWLATLHGAWRLALPTSRSAVAAWMAGAMCVVHSPLRSVATALVWLAPVVAVTVGSAVAIQAAAAHPLVASVAEAVASAVRALCWVGLFASFAPTAGIDPTEGTDD